MTTEIYANICKILNAEAINKKIETIGTKKRIELLFKAVKKAFAVDAELLASNSRAFRLVFIRYAFTKIAKEQIGVHNNIIAEALNRDRTLTNRNLAQADLLLSYHDTFIFMYNRLKSEYDKIILNYLDRNLCNK